MARGDSQSDIWETTIGPYAIPNSWEFSNDRHIPITVGLSAKTWESRAWGWLNYVVELSIWNIWVQHVSEKSQVWFLKSKVGGCGVVANILTNTQDGTQWFKLYLATAQTLQNPSAFILGAPRPWACSRARSHLMDDWVGYGMPFRFFGIPSNFLLSKRSSQPN